MKTRDCRKIKAHSGHKHLTDYGRVVAWCEGRDYALQLAYAVILDAPDNPTDGEVCKCHGLVWNFRDVRGGLCPFSV